MKDFITEVEAKTKLCPYSFASEHNERCEAALCMAWRWSNQDTGPTDAPTGYCGAFGYPQMRGR